MATNPIIKPRRGTSTPGVSSLQQNELAVDTTNKRIFIGAADGSGTLIGSAPGGANTQVQFNDSGVMGGDSGLTYNKTTDTLTVGGNLVLNAQGDIRFADSDSSNYVAFQAPSTVSSDVTWTLPSSDGSSGEFLSTNGSGTLSWSGSGAISWSVITSDQSLSVDTGVLANKSSGTLTLTLPATSAVGKVIRISGMQNVWKIAQNSGQTIHFGKFDTTTGTGGYIESSNERDCIELVCCVADTEWNVISSIGNITIA